MLARMWNLALGCSCVACGNVKWYNRVGKQHTVSYKFYSIHFLWLNFIPRYLPKRNKITCPQKHFYVDVHDGFMHNGPKLENLFSLTGKWINKLRYICIVGNYWAIKMRHETSCLSLTDIVLSQIYQKK